MAPKQHSEIQLAREQGGAASGPLPDPVAAGRLEARWISGPIPSADELARYEQVIPGAAERILRFEERKIAMVEDQVHHRIQLERTVVGSDHVRSYIGLVMGFAVTIGAMWLVYQLGMHGHDILAGTTFLGDMGSMVYLFVVGSNLRRSERQERLKALMQEQRDAGERPGRS